MALIAFKQKIETLEHRMYTHSLHKDPSLESLYNLCEKKAQVIAWFHTVRDLVRVCKLWD